MRGRRQIAGKAVLNRIPFHPLVVAGSLCVMVLSGCAAFHPVAGVPASYLPAELAPESRNDKRTIDLSLLRQTPPPVYRLDAGDTLGIYIEGVLGREGDVPPVYIPQQEEGFAPSLGYPVPVREDGTIFLPTAGTIPVRGMTIRELENRLRQIYVHETETFQPGAESLFVSLQRPRTYQVLVIRQEEGNDLSGGGGGVGQVNLGSLKRGTGQAVNLPAYKNDVLHALAATNGLPGLDAENAVYIIRGGNLMHDGYPTPYPSAPTHAPMTGSHIQQTGYESHGGHTVPPMNAPVGPGFGPMMGGHTPPPAFDAEPMIEDYPHAIGHGIGSATIDGPKTVKIPIRLSPGETPHFTEADITLHEGDIVFIESRDTEVFYTGGLLGGGQYTLPRDYDLDILEAISIAQSNGQAAGGGGQQQAIGGTSALNNDVSVSASHAVIIRRLPNGDQFPIKVDLYKARRRPQERVVIQSGDYIMLQYTPWEATLAFVERHLLAGALFGLFAGDIVDSGN